MTIYIDKDFKCHLADDGTMRAVETAACGGKCAEYIEGHRYVPTGETWTREDGEVFTGEMFSPWVDSATLEEAQRAYEREQLAALKAQNADMAAALEVLGVTE